MFGRRNSAFIKKLKKQGKPAAGRVADIITNNEPDRLVRTMVLPDPRPFTVIITFVTDIGKEEWLVMHTTDSSPYALGFDIPVRYYYENGVCFAAPESVVNK